MAKRRRTSRAKVSNANIRDVTRINRRSALAWLFFGMVVGAILMFTLIQGSLLSPTRFSPSNPNELGLSCTMSSIASNEGISCNEACSDVNKACVFGQRTDNQAVSGCLGINNNPTPVNCVCC